MRVAPASFVIARHHVDLVCFQLASELNRVVYEETARDPWKRDWKLRDDLRRACRSVPANIAEGFWRYHRVDFARFLGIALGSLGETEVHIQTALADCLIEPSRHAELQRLILRTRVATRRLRAYLTTSPSGHGTSKR